jgi:DUF4097 and DUF4098 domain-containing protein YvlB
LSVNTCQVEAILMISLLFATLSALAASPVVIDEARATRLLDEPRTARVDARGASRIVIVARAGWLRVEGKSGATEVIAEGTARAPSNELLEDIKLTGAREGDIVRIIVEMPDMTHRDWESHWGNGPSLDLTVTVPATIPVEIEDSSGDLRVMGTAALDVDDNSGDVEIRDVGGALRVKDGSGGLEIENVRGDVTIEDGSGEIDVRDVTGSVSLRDGSGSITARGVGGSVHVLRDGSGGIRVVDVGGDLVVERSRKKGVSYSGVKGNVRLE